MCSINLLAKILRQILAKRLNRAWRHLDSLFSRNLDSFIELTNETSQGTCDASVRHCGDAVEREERENEHVPSFSHRRELIERQPSRGWVWSLPSMFPCERETRMWPGLGTWACPRRRSTDSSVFQYFATARVGMRTCGGPQLAMLVALPRNFRHRRCKPPSILTQEILNFSFSRLCKNPDKPAPCWEENMRKRRSYCYDARDFIPRFQPCLASSINRLWFPESLQCLQNNAWCIIIIKKLYFSDLRKIVE